MFETIREIAKIILGRNISGSTSLGGNFGYADFPDAIVDEIAIHIYREEPRLSVGKTSEANRLRVD